MYCCVCADYEPPAQPRPTNETEVHVDDGTATGDGYELPLPTEEAPPIPRDHIPYEVIL